MISMEGSDTQDEEIRRKVNKNFMECLVEAENGVPGALIWLKKHIDFEICNIIIQDWKYSGGLSRILIIKHHILCTDKLFSSRPPVAKALKVVIMSRPP